MTDSPKQSGGDAAGLAGGEPQQQIAPEAPWPLYEVFVRARRGLSHVHVGSVHAVDSQMAMHNARDVYTRRAEGESLWVVPSSQITASDPHEKESLFEPATDKPYRHPTFYDVPDGITNM